MKALRVSGCRPSLRLAVLLGLSALVAGCQPTGQGADSAGEAAAPTGILEGGPYELVLTGGRVMDPESGTDAVLNVGIREGRIVALTADPLEGAETLDVEGLVVAPGFVDLHAHGQDEVSARLMALDGVTVQLDLEMGAFPVTTLLEQRRGQAVVHFGVSVSHPAARVALFEDEFVGHVTTQPPDAPALSTEKRSTQAEATPEQQEELLALLDEGLRQGGLGFGLGIVYTPGASRLEILRVFQIAARRGVPIFVHMRGNADVGPIGDVQEMLADAAATGAALHIVHLNSSTDELAPQAMEMIRGARERGLDVTTEAYPYTAGSTLIQSALFDAWVGLPEEEYQKLEWPSTGERLTRASFERYRKEGGWVIMHTREEETNTWVTAQPDIMVASDGIPFLYGPAHPRGSGTHARVLGRYARDKGALSLMDALAKMTIQPARRLEDFAPLMARKGRASLGADADLTVFDPDTVIDRATYSHGDAPSEGIEHVLVEGTFVVRGGEFQEGVFPGKAIVSDVAVDAPTP